MKDTLVADFVEPLVETLAYRIELTKEFFLNTSSEDSMFTARLCTFESTKTLMRLGVKRPAARTMGRVDDQITCVWGNRLITDAPPRLDEAYAAGIEKAELRVV